MTKLDLLFALRHDTQDLLKELRLPVRYQKSDDTPPELRAPAVYLMRLPDGKQATKMAPYVLHQAVTGTDKEPTGKHWESYAIVRTIVCVYHPDEQLGGLQLLDVMERLRVHWQECPVVDRRFKLDTDEGLESLIYNNDTAPYYAGEIATTWWIPPGGRPVTPWLYENDWTIKDQ